MRDNGLADRVLFHVEDAQVAVVTTRCQPFAGRVKGHRINEVGMLEVVAGRISCQLPLLHGLVQAGREERTGAGEDNARNRIQLRERLDQLAELRG